MPTTTVDKITALLEQENPDAPFFVYHEAIKQIRDEVANMNPNGGSQPTLHKVTVTAAEIAAAWDAMNNQAVITTTFTPDGFLAGLVIGALPDSLPANMSMSAYAASDTGFSAPLADSQAINASDISYQTFGGISVPSFTNAASAFVATREGAVCDGTEPIVLFVTGDSAPLSGSADIYFIVWPLA